MLASVMLPNYNHANSNSPLARKSSAIILAWHIQVATQHLALAAEDGERLHSGTPYAGLIRAAFALTAILSDPASAADYDGTATADEILRCLLGSFATKEPSSGAPANNADCMPATEAYPLTRPIHSSEVPAAVVAQANLDPHAIFVTQGALGL